MLPALTLSICPLHSHLRLWRPFYRGAPVAGQAAGVCKKALVFVFFSLGVMCMATRPASIGCISLTQQYVRDLCMYGVHLFCVCTVCLYCVNMQTMLSTRRKAATRFCLPVSMLSKRCVCERERQSEKEGGVCVCCVCMCVVCVCVCESECERE